MEQIRKAATKTGKDSPAIAKKLGRKFRLTQINLKNGIKKNIK